MSVIYGGYTQQPGRWTSNLKLGGVNTPTVEFVIDDTLPSLGQDLQLPNRDFLVIPRGRFVAAKATTLTRLAGETIVTLANGVDPKAAPSFATGANAGNIPFGYAPFHMYRNFSGLPADRPLGVKHETIEVPYTAINEAYNTSTNGGTRLMVGEWVMPYYGVNNLQTAITPNHKGKAVRWVERQIFQTRQAASTTCQLTSAPFPFALPRVIFAVKDTGVTITSGATVSYDETTGQWKAVFTEAVTSVTYEYGASSQQKIGQVIGIEPVSTAGGINATSHDMNGYLRWVTDNFGAWDWPPILNTHNYTAVTDENVTISSLAGTLAHYPVVPTRTITVSVTGTLTNPDGSTTTLAGAMSPADSNFFNDFSQGQYFDIDFMTGAISFSSNVSVTSCKVSYSYESAFADGLRYDQGIQGLTNGRDSGIVGLPAHLDIAGVLGALRIMVL